MFKKIDIEIKRSVNPIYLDWPDEERAEDDSGLCCNRDYMDFRGQTWEEAERALESEASLLKQLEDSSNPAAMVKQIIEERFEDGDFHTGPDIGVESTVMMLSAAGCVPCTSCNGGCFGDDHYGVGHHEDYPLVVFFAKPAWLPDILAAAEEASVGLDNDDRSLVVYANDILNMLSFARALKARRNSFLSYK